MSDFPISWVRRSFPALNNSENFVFFDNGAGAQAPQVVLDAVQDHLLSRNVQRGGRYRRSQEVDAAIQKARESIAIFLNAREPDEVAFGRSHDELCFDRQWRLSVRMRRRSLPNCSDDC